MKLKIILFLIVLCATVNTFAHPMPHSVMSMDIKKEGIFAELSLPLKEFQLIFPEEDLEDGYLTLIQRRGNWLDQYLLQHLSISDSSGHPWVIKIEEKQVSENEQSLTGKYHELTFKLWLQAPDGSSPRHFIMRYDVIMHQLVTHKLFLHIKKDWYGGMTDKDSLNANLGVLSVNPADNSISPVIINLDEGSTWKGFKTMVNLGIRHISEGTDHLLFLLVLLLPASLISENKRWIKVGDTKYSLIRLAKIVTAFTLGHSISLFLGAMKWLALPQQPVEIAIAITILITAIHAIRPLFFGKEMFIAAGFGLIHGLAFSSVLSEMNLGPMEMMYSILGFNAGIELMQLFVIFCTVPWLLVLSKKKNFSWLRVGAAGFAILSSFAWVMERVSGQTNIFSKMVEQIAQQGKWLIALLAISALLSLLFSKKERV